MKITIEHEGVLLTIEDEKVDDIYDTFQLIKQALLGLGFQLDNINDCLDEELI